MIINQAQSGLLMTHDPLTNIVAEKYIDGDNFFLTYGDGVSNINIKELLDFHLKNGKIGTVTSILSNSAKVRFL